MRRKQIATMVVGFCALMVATAGGAASMPVTAPDAPTRATDDPAVTTMSLTAAGDATEATDSTLTNSSGQVNDCDLMDIDGNDNTISTNITGHPSDDENGNVSVQLHCELDSTGPIDNDLIDIDGDNNSVSLTVRAENGTLLLGTGSSGENNGPGFDIASQCDGGTLAECDMVDIDGENNSVNLVVRSNGGRTVYEFGTGSASSPRCSPTSHSAAGAVSYYQVDLVTGEPIQNLRGSEGYYTPDRLLRFAHGSTDTPVMRRSDGTFTTNQSVANRIETQNITVTNGTAMTTFTVANGSEPVTLTLASYRKVGPGWSPKTEAEQEFVDSDTETFEPGTYTLTVDLPNAESDAND